MSGNDYIKFMTGEIISYLDLTTEDKKERKNREKSSQHVLSNRWLGMVPLAMKMLWKKAN